MFKKQTGYSVLEALIVLVLVAIIAVVAAPTLFRFLQVYRIQTAAQQIAINMRFARNAAVKNKTKFQVKINNETAIPPNEYWVLYDANGDGTFDTNTEQYKHADVFLPPALSILTGSLSTVTFDARGGVSPAGTVTLKGTDLSQYQITVTAAGGVSFVKTVEGIY